MKNYTIDLTNADGYVVTEDDEIKKFLKKKGLDNGEFLFTAIDGDRHDEFQKYGTYRKNNRIYAFTFDEFVMSSDNQSFDLDTAIGMYTNPIVAIYKSNHFNKDVIDYKYEFIQEDKKSDALHGLLKLI